MKKRETEGLLSVFEVRSSLNGTYLIYSTVHTSSNSGRGERG